jgi:hypothetical protein
MKTPEEILSEIEREPEAPDASAAIPAVTKFHVDVIGTRGVRYQGDFIYRVPRMIDQVSIGRLKSEYLPQGGMADPNAAIIVEQLCYLAVTIQDPKPAWWKPSEFYDAAPLGAVYKEALDYERKFHGGDADDSEARSGVGSDGILESDGPESASEAPMGRKVQPPTKRRETLVAHSERSG